MPPRKRRPRTWEYLPDGEVLFRRYYTDMGSARSFGKLAKWCASEGFFHPKSGKIPTPTGLWRRMWRWALSAQNQALAYEIYNEAMKDEGKFITPQMWKETLDLSALTCIGRSPRIYRMYLNGKLPVP